MIRSDIEIQNSQNTMLVDANGVDLEDSLKVCRECGSRENQEDMIKPCLCDGRNRYVHRKCLNKKRCNTKIPRSFRECDKCSYEYWIAQQVSDGEESSACCKRRFKSYELYFARDSVAGILILHLILSMWAWFLAIVDNDFSRIIPADCCPQTQYNFYNYDSGNTQCPGLCGTQHAPSGGKLLNSLPPWIAQHTKTAYYLCSCVTMLIMMGVAGMMLLACMDKDDRAKTLGAGWSSLFCCCFCGNGCRDCCTEEEQRDSDSSCGSCGNCRGANCNNVNCGGGEGALVILAVVIVLVLFYSFFVGFLVILSFILRAIQNRYHYWQRRHQCKMFVVMDLEDRDLAPDAEGRAYVAPDYDDTNLKINV